MRFLLYLVSCFSFATFKFRFYWVGHKVHSGFLILPEGTFWLTQYFKLLLFELEYVLVQISLDSSCLGVLVLSGPALKKFSAIIFSKMISAPFSLLSPGNSVMQMLVYLMLSLKLSSFLNIFFSFAVLIGLSAPFYLPHCLYCLCIIQYAVEPFWCVF